MQHLICIFILRHLHIPFHGGYADGSSGFSPLYVTAWVRARSQGRFVSRIPPTGLQQEVVIYAGPEHGYYPGLSMRQAHQADQVVIRNHGDDYTAGISQISFHQ